MSKPRDPWWPYIKNVLRAYPGLKRELQALRQQSVTVRYNPAGGGSGPGRSTEQTALRELSKAKMKRISAVEKATSITKRKHRKDGTAKTRLDLIEKTYYTPGGKLTRAADDCYISYPTAVRYQKEFIWLIARELELTDD